MPFKATKELVKPSDVKPKRTNNVYKYTERFVSKELDSMLVMLSENLQISTKAQLFALKPYSPKKFSQWRNKYSESKRIAEKLEKIDNILESRLITQGLTAKNFPFIIFLLKNNYGYQDKRETEIEHTHTFNVTRGDLKALKKASRLKVPATVK